MVGPPDREGLAPEIWFGTTQVAELNREKDKLTVEIYSRLNSQPWSLNLNEFLNSLLASNEKLVGQQTFAPWAHVKAVAGRFSEISRPNPDFC